MLGQLGPMTNDDSFSQFLTIFRSVQSDLETITTKLYALLLAHVEGHEATETPNSGPDFVAQYVELMRASCSEELRRLGLARRFLEDDANFEFVASAKTWRGAWVLDDWQSIFRAVVASTLDQPSVALGAFSSGKASYRQSRAGYVFEEQAVDGKAKLVPVGHETECLMELLAAVWCGLALLGTRADKLWSRVLHIAGEETNGFPTGVCLYKAFGDVYRNACKDLALLKGTADPDYLELNNPRVRQLFSSPSIFGDVDLSGIPPSQLDLSPYVFRRAGALYYVIHQIAYLRSGNHFTLLWGYDGDAVQKSFVESEAPRKWLRFAYGRKSYSVKDQMNDPNRSVKFAFWAIPANRLAVSIPVCVLGVRHGVLSMQPGPRTRYNSVPFSGRSVADDMFVSMVLTIRGIAEDAKQSLLKGAEDEVPQDGIVDLLDISINPQQDRRPSRSALA